MFLPFLKEPFEAFGACGRPRQVVKTFQAAQVSLIAPDEILQCGWRLDHGSCSRLVLGRCLGGRRQSEGSPTANQNGQTASQGTRGQWRNPKESAKYFSGEFH